MTPWVQNLQHLACEITQTLFLWQSGLPSQRWPRVRRCCLAQPVKADGQKGSPWDQAAHPSKAVPYSPSEGKGSELFPASCKALNAKEMLVKYEQSQWEATQYWAETWAKDHKLDIPVRSAQQSVSEETSVSHCDCASELFLNLFSKHLSVCVFTRNAASTTDPQLPIYCIII